MATAVRTGFFSFTGESTIADLIMVGKTLEATGRSPKLRFVRSYLNEIEAVEIDSDPARVEITSAGRDVLREEAPDPAAGEGGQNDPRWARVTDETQVYWSGNWTTWGELSGNERTECVISNDGIVVGGFAL